MRLAGYGLGHGIEPGMIFGIPQFPGLHHDSGSFLQFIARQIYDIFVTFQRVLVHLLKQEYPFTFTPGDMICLDAVKA